MIIFYLFLDFIKLLYIFYIIWLNIVENSHATGNRHQFALWQPRIAFSQGLLNLLMD
jgi:hypothetical protein